MGIKNLFATSAGFVLAGAMVSSHAIAASDIEASHSSAPSTRLPSKVIDPNTGEMRSLAVIRADGTETLKISAGVLKSMQSLQEDVELGMPVASVAVAAKPICNRLNSPNYYSDGQELRALFKTAINAHVSLGLKDNEWAAQQMATFEVNVVNPTIHNEKMTKKACDSLAPRTK